VEDTTAPRRTFTTRTAGHVNDDKPDSVMHIHIIQYFYYSVVDVIPVPLLQAACGSPPDQGNRPKTRKSNGRDQIMSEDITSRDDR
jgi:hypothetical protein